MDVKVKIAIFSGFIAIILAWSIILISIHYNPWFNITHNALSDLGGGNLINNGHPAPKYPEIYNYGLIFTGIAMTVFSVFSISAAKNKILISGYSFFIISSLFLALIGIYHEGTYPHDFVSIWFFILASFSYFVISAGIILNYKAGTGVLMIIIDILSWILYLIIPWQSVAEDEVFGVAVIDILVLLNIYTMLRENKYSSLFRE